MSEIKQPASALSSPRFCNMGTFMRMQKVDTAEGLDFAIAGAPFDTGSSFRSGSRFGPNAIRNISAMMKPNNVIMQVNIMESLKGGDIGDFNITPGYIHPSYDAIEKGVAGILEKNACPIVLGGDHAITLAELRAVAKKYGPVALVHFDSHSDLCDEVFGQKYNHGTPFRRAIEEGLIDPSHSIQIGMRGSLYDPNEHKMAAELGMKLIPAHKVLNTGDPFPWCLSFLLWHGIIITNGRILAETQSKCSLAVYLHHKLRNIKLKKCLLPFAFLQKGWSKSQAHGPAYP